MKKFSLICVGLLTISCAHQLNMTHNDNNAKQCLVPIILAATSETPNELIDYVKDGALYWNEILGHRMFIHGGQVDLSIDGPYLGGFIAVGIVPNLSRTDWHHRNKKEPCGRTYMAFKPNGCIARAKIKINASCAEDVNELQTVIRHEIGHVLGLDDSADFTALMSCTIEETVQHPVDANEEEIKILKQLYHIP